MATSELELSDEDVALLNTKIGLKHLLADDKVDVARALAQTRYELAMRDLQEDMVELQRWVIESGARVVVIFEGRDAAGKGGAIRRITAHINPRHFRSVALGAPTEDERGQWYFQRYVSMLPSPGTMTFFDRSWYNRAIVEPVNGFCSDDEHAVFMGQVNEYERMLVESGIHLIKLYFQIGKAEQRRRFKAIKADPLTHWKMTKVDERAQGLWKAYTSYERKMLAHTDTDLAPWTVIDANDVMAAHLVALRHILDVVPWASEGSGKGRPGTKKG